MASKATAEQPENNKVRGFLRKNLFALNFFRVHLIYFLTFIIIGSLFVYLLPGGGYNISYINALSLCSSAMTTTGLNVVDLGDLSTGQQVILVLLMLIGNQIFTGSFVVWVRRYYFRQHFKEIVALAKKKHCSVQDAEDGEAKQSEQPPSSGSTAENDNNEGETHTGDVPESDEAGNKRPKEESDQSKDQEEASKAKSLVDHTRSQHKGLGAFPSPFEIEALKAPLKWINPSTRSADDLNHDYLSFSPAIKGNSHFHGLSTEQEEELGGVEYAALELLTWLLPLYLFGWILLGIIILAPWAKYTHINTLIRTDQPGNLNPVWFASFLSVSAFVNCGFDLLNSSFSELNGEYLIILATIVLLLAGNTLFPVLLRLDIWLINICGPKQTRLRATTRFLLDHPRRTFFSLFPAYETWNLVFITIIFQGFAWGMYVALNSHNSVIETPYTTSEYLLAGFFQSVAIRHGGFYIVTLSSLAPGMLVLYITYMYISNYPAVLALRASNVYEEHSLGVSSDDAQDIGLMPHIQGQLFYDVWWLVLSYFLIAVIESRHFLDLETNGFTLFAVLFEVLSAYGNVGASLSLVGQDFSLSGDFHILSKLVLIAVMIRGRHRSLPSAIDRSIMLPGEKTQINLDRGRPHDD